MRLIDADALKEKMRRTNRYFYVKFDIDEAPTIDAVPLVHGRNTRDEAKEHCDFMCSVCGAWAADVAYGSLDGGNFNFCPNCGAKMDGGE